MKYENFLTKASGYFFSFSESSAQELGMNEDFLEKLVKWCTTEEHPGVKGVFPLSYSNYDINSLNI